MKKTLLSSLLLLFACLMQAQITITVSGFITRVTDGTPVEDWTISAFAIDPQDSTQFGFADGLTDVIGYYEFEVEIPANLNEITLEVETGCYDGSPEVITETLQIVNSAASADFEICADPPPPADCEAWFELESLDSLTIQFTAYFETIDSAIAVSWFWDFGDGTTSTEENPIHDYNQDGIYDVTLTIVSESGCEATITDHICVGGYQSVPECEAWFETENLDSLTVQFTSYFETVDSAVAVSWFWDFGDGETSTEENPIHDYNQDGIYDVTLTIVSESGCESTIADHICVGEFQPVPECEAWFETENLDSLTVQFTSYFETADSAVAVSWFWDFGDGETSMEAQPVHEYAQGGVYEVNLIIFSETGCQASSTEHICVGYTDPGDPECSVEPNVEQLDSLTFAFSAEFFTLDSAAAQSWFWDFGDGNTSTEENPIHTYDEDGFYEVTVFVTSTSGCEVELSFPLFTDQPPNTDCEVYIEYEDLDSLTYVFSSEAYGLTGDQVGVLSYFWQFDDGTTSNDPDPTHTFPDEGIYSVELTVLTEDSCLVTASAVIVIGDSPVDTFFYGCQAMFFVSDVGADSLTLSFEDLSFGSPVEWYWEFGDGETSEDQNPTHTYEESGVYLVELSILTSAGCESNISFDICVLEDCPWQGEQDCQALFIPLPDSLGGLGFEFVDLSYSPNVILSWNWDFGDGETSNEQNPFHVYAQHGVYTVTLSIEADSCESEISFDLDTEEPWNFSSNAIAALGVATGTQLATKEHEVAFKSVQLFPNPVQSTLNLLFEANNPETYTLNVTDLTGRSLVSSQRNSTEGTNLTQLDVSQLLPGFYLLELRTSKTVQVLKFVRQ